MQPKTILDGSSYPTLPRRALLLAIAASVIAGVSGFALGRGNGEAPVYWVGDRTGQFDILSGDFRSGCFTSADGSRECGEVVWLGPPGSIDVNRLITVEVLRVEGQGGSLIEPVFLVGLSEGPS